MSDIESSASASRAPEIFVAMSRFEVRNDRDDAIHDAFVNRPHLVDDADGFIGMEVFRGIENPKEFWLLTRWRDEAAYKTWHRGHTYQASHKGIPKGTKLLPKSTKITLLRRICD